jgi:hypothetical protein
VFHGVRKVVNFMLDLFRFSKSNATGSLNYRALGTEGWATQFLSSLVIPFRNRPDGKPISAAGFHTRVVPPPPPHPSVSRT